MNLFFLFFVSQFHYDISILLQHRGEMTIILITKHNLSEEELLSYLNHMKNTVTKPFALHMNDLRLTTHFDISIYSDSYTFIKGEQEGLSSLPSLTVPDQHTSPDQMYSHILTPKTKEYLTGEFLFRKNLYQAIDKNELFLVFQPQYNCHNNSIRGFEALVRWDSKKYGLVCPSKFIPIANEMELIVPMGQWIIEKALSQFQEILTYTSDSCIFSINLAPVQLMHPEFLNSFFQTLSKSNFPPENLEIELTESALIHSVENMVTILKQIRSMGVKIALDDFGAGSSSLCNLQKLPLDTLKIDKSIIDQITVMNTNDYIVESIISLAHKLNLQVIAEGVEHNIQLSSLKGLYCDCIQGFLLSKPHTKDEICRLLSNTGLIRKIQNIERSS